MGWTAVASSSSLVLSESVSMLLLRCLPCQISVSDKKGCIISIPPRSGPLLMFTSQSVNLLLNIMSAYPEQRHYQQLLLNTQAA